MKHCTDILIEELLEAYTSQAAPIEADRQQAIKDFEFELKNGPKKRVVYANGKAFDKNIGTFDLDLFHKAYDEWFEKNGLLDLFAADGTLAQKSDYYTKIKPLDRNEPAVKGLYDLYGIQFGNSNGMIFTHTKRAQEAQKAAQERLEAEAIEQKKTLAAELVKKIEELPVWIEYVKLHPADLQAQVKPWVSVDTAVSADASMIKVRSVVVEVDRGVMPFSSNYYDRQEHKVIQRVANITLNKDSKETSWQQKVLHETNKAISQLLIPAARVFNYLSPTAEVFKNSPLGKIEINFQNKFKDQSDQIYYLDPADDAIYYCRPVVFKGIQHNVQANGFVSRAEIVLGLGFILTDAKNPQIKSKLLTPELIPIAIRTDSWSSNNGRGYYQSSWYEAYNSKYAGILKAAGYDFAFPDASRELAPVETDKATETGKISYPGIFDVEHHRSYSLDSSD